MEKQQGSHVSDTLILQRMVTQLQTQLSVIAMHCAEIEKLCKERADPRRVDSSCRTLKEEEQAIVSSLKDIMQLKGSLRLPDQQQLDTKLRSLSQEYANVLRSIRTASTQGNNYCHHMRSMTASLHRSVTGPEDEPPRRISLGEGLGALTLAQEDAVFDSSAQEEQLETDVRQLSEMFDLLLAHTTDQGRRIDTLEAHMEAAAAEAHAGAVKMTEAAEYSASAVPIVAALVGGVVGGPIGVLAGLKGAAALTAVAGVGAGYLTGHWYKKRVHASAKAAREELNSKTK